VSGADDPEIARMAAELAGARSHLANLTVRGLRSLEPEEYRVVFEAAREKKEAAERALAAANAEFARELGRGKLGLQDVAASLPDKAALVAYVLYEREDLTPSKPGTDAISTDEPKAPSPPVRWYAAFIAQRGEEPLVVQLGPAEEIDLMISRWKREAARGMILTSRTPKEAETEYRAVGARLRVKIWDPLVNRLGGVERVFVVPDGELNLVSFAALPVSGSSYLIEDGPLLHYLSAERDLVPEPPVGKPGRGLIAIGGPSFDEVPAPADRLALPETEGIATRGGTRWKQPSCVDFESLQFEPLPAADHEARQIVTIWQTNHVGEKVDGQVIHLSGATAKESTFTKEAPGRRVLHLATHGFFLGQHTPASRNGSRGIGGLSVIEPAQVPDVACENPLLLSGLALAGANHRVANESGETDGILTAEEIAGLDLSGVEWAVLSACDTGVGEIRAGEGVFGLRRAIQIAGVQTLIMSLWQVDDDASRQWMKSLYEGRLGKKLDTVEAVQAASLAVLNSRRAAEESTHPFFWAAFVAAGDWH
jgi:CHAT domain-containing protein